MTPRERTAAICAAHWANPRTRCVGCPLWTPCAASLPRQPYTAADIAAHRARLDAAACEIPHDSPIAV